MLKIIIEQESVQTRYRRLKEQLGNPTDSIMIDNLIDVYIASKCPVNVSNDYATDTNHIVEIDLDNKPKRGKSKQ